MKSLAVLLTGLALLGGRIEAQDKTMTPHVFKVRYVATVKELEAGKDLRLWIPVPSDDAWQKIKNLQVKGAPTWTITREPTLGNRMVFIETKTEAPELAVEVTYEVERNERTTDLVTMARDGNAAGESVTAFLVPSKLGIVDDRIRSLAAKLGEGKTTTLAKGRAFYDHVLAEMQYGKPEGKAWGRGDTVYACDSRVGNCTDFHAYFISLCHAAKIPARFQIGIYGNYDRKPGEEYETGGYHCWAEFHVPGKGWVPVDISEADKEAARANYFFGNHTDNRVTLSMGRDLDLEPRQGADKLNYFLNPHAEVSGKPHKAVGKKSYWTDL